MPFSSPRLVPLPVQRRTVLAGALAVLAGCTSVDREGTETPNDGYVPVRGEPGEYPHEILAENESDQPVALTLVVRRGGASLYSGTHEVDRGSRTVIGGFTVEAFPPERQYVTVTATTADGESASAGVSVSECLGDVVVSLAESGAVSVTYSTCRDDRLGRAG